MAKFYFFLKKVKFERKYIPKYNIFIELFYWLLVSALKVFKDA